MCTSVNSVFATFFQEVFGFLSLFLHGLFGLSFEFDFLIKVLSPGIVFFQSAIEAQKQYIKPFPSSGKLVQL